MWCDVYFIRSAGENPALQPCASALVGWGGGCGIGVGMGGRELPKVPEMLRLVTLSACMHA